MVVLTVATTENSCTVYFDEPIPNADHVRLISCLLYNSWQDWKRRGELQSFQKDNEAFSVFTFSEGHSTLEGMAKELENVFHSEKVKSDFSVLAEGI